MPALLIRLRPEGPWRYGPQDGSLDNVDTLYRSDRLFSAITLAMGQLGSLGEWLDATARADRPAVAFGSLFPFQAETLFAIPPASLWPPPAAQVAAPSSVFLAKFRWSAAKFVPVSLIDALLSGESILADQWLPDGESGCLLRRDRPSASPFRTAFRRTSAVDRVAGIAHGASTTACIEFEPGAGLWTVVRFADGSAETTWRERIEAAFRLLSDTGFGGKRTSGWGQSKTPEFQSGDWPNLLFPRTGRLSRRDKNREDGANGNFWLLSLFSPGRTDGIDWSGGSYEITVRSGRVEGNGAAKKLVRMVAEGSVLSASSELCGAAVDVAPENHAHPVYRSGLALSLRLPVIPPVTTDEKKAEEPVEEAASEEALVDSPCDTRPQPESSPLVSEGFSEAASRTEVGDQHSEREGDRPVDVRPETEEAEPAPEPAMPAPTTPEPAAEDARPVVQPQEPGEPASPDASPEDSDHAL